MLKQRIKTVPVTPVFPSSLGLYSILQAPEKSSVTACCPRAVLQAPSPPRLLPDSPATVINPQGVEWPACTQLLSDYSLLGPVDAIMRLPHPCPKTGTEPEGPLSSGCL